MIVEHRKVQNVVPHLAIFKSENGHETAKNGSYGGISYLGVVFDEFYDFEVELGPRWPKMTENEPKHIEKIKNLSNVGG